MGPIWRSRMTAPLGLGNRHLRLPLIFLIAILSWAPYLVTARSAQQSPLVLSAEQETKLHLAPLLSGGASLSFPRDSSWGELTARVAAPRVAPQFFAVVEVATEADVEHTIKFANEYCHPFLAVSGSHGFPTSMGKIHRGIQINLRRLNTIKVSEDGETATAGGGILQHETVRDLFAKGKMAATGLCACVSFAGPLLGGGHSMLQARHGFSADNLVSARLTLANGSSITASSEENAELFWGLKGVGHNLGVVTSFDVKVYDADELWAMDVLIFTQDKLEELFEVFNQLEDDIADPGLLVAGGAIAWNPELDKENPVINIQLFSAGTATSIDAYIAAFRALGPAASFAAHDIPYGDIFTTAGLGVDNPVCRKEANLLALPSSVDRWDPAAMRAGFTLFADFTRSPMSPFGTSIWLIESYGRKGVRDVPVDSAAVPAEERERHILHSPILWWDGSSEQEREQVREWAARYQAAVAPRDAEPHFYVNYAQGGEALDLVYGKDQERLERLRRLKKEWDPDNRFGFYNPIR
ncbi:fumiquinazoline A oxidase [Microdochium nivale]|nr:fumiquinazoline A oxidase [Microdochium nivale]